jgi:2-oxo-4-hydroxy-4-carboxy--5-ureidoimidazoline (OHCU) decarboxylase
MDTLPPPRIDLLVHAPSPASYRPVLEQLLEPSQQLSTLLAPQLHARIAALPASNRPKSYAELIDLAKQTVDSWDVEDQAAFLAAHPRIGETKGLSQASAGEQAPQQGQQATPAQVLKRLQVRSRVNQPRVCVMASPAPEELTLLGSVGHPHAQVLNSLYEDAFPGLRYITFVNGRSRAEIVPELEVRGQTRFTAFQPSSAAPAALDPLDCWLAASD